MGVFGFETSGTKRGTRCLFSFVGKKGAFVYVR